MRTLLVFLVLASPAWAQYPPEAPPIPSPESQLRALGWDFDPLPAADVGAPVTVDWNCAVLVGAQDICAAGIARLQHTLNESQLGHVTARLTSVMQSTLVPSGNLATDLTRAYQPSDGFGDDIIARRNSDGADCTVVITTSSNFCGQAYVEAGPTSCLAMVYQGCLDNFSYEHEVGHNAGLAHDQPNSTHGGYQQVSYGWCAGCGHKDGMVYPSPCGGERIARFSNKRQFCPFHPTVPFGSNNADGYWAWLNRAPIMENFRQPTGAPAPPGKPFPLED